jgi:branched-chain amino acid transport system permease protein
MNFIKTHKTIFGFIITLAIYALLPVFIKSPYTIDLLIVIVINSILAMCFVMMLRTGLMNLGLAAFWGMGAYLSAILVMNFHMSFWLALPVSSILTAFMALCIGSLIIKNGGFPFILLSAVLGMLFSVLVGNISYIGGYYGISDIPVPEPISIPLFPTIEFNSKFPFFFISLFILAIVILIIKAFYSAWTGRAWNAIGLNPRLAESIGVDVFKYRLLSFVIASAIAGLIGAFYAHYARYIIPTNYGMWVNINIQIYAILGGIGYPVAGPFVGSILMTFFPELFRGAGEVSQIFTGILLVLLILFMPTGLLGLWENRSNYFNYILRFIRNIPVLLKAKDLSD